MESDKSYWHQYLETYERLVFSELYGQLNIMEFGVAGGASIEHLLERFPTAMIFGIDIIEHQAGWPKSSRVFYINVDQSNQQHVRSMFGSLNKRFDLIIDDGSHEPSDQAKCLLESLPWITPNGFYILEDVHTSFADKDRMVNAFQVLLALQHLKAVERKLTNDVSFTLTQNSYFSPDEITYLYENVRSIYLYKRTHLPLRCYNCKNINYDYVNLICRSCGVNLYKQDDSMSFIIRKN